MYSKMTPLMLVCGWLIAVSPIIAHAQGRAPIWQSDRTIFSEDGYIKLEWGLINDTSTVEVQQSITDSFSDFQTVYKGPDNATFISGLPDGSYFYRIRKPEGEWSQTLTVTVSHHSLTLAFTLFGLGAIVFLLTVWVVIKGAIQTSSSNPN